MKRTLIALALGALTAGAALPAQAQTNVRQLNQERRIDAGVRSGKLTHHEATKLKAQQRSISHEAQAMRAENGGHLTGIDKATLHARQDHANANILNKKHNRARGPNKLKV